MAKCNHFSLPNCFSVFKYLYRINFEEISNCAKSNIDRYSYCYNTILNKKKIIFATVIREILVKYRLHVYPCSIFITLRSYILNI